MPNLSSASSAASSARSMSLSRLAASARKCESIDSASFTMSAGRLSGFSKFVASSREEDGSASSVVALEGSSTALTCSGDCCERDRDRVRLRSSVKPLDAEVLAVVYSFWAS